MKIANLSFQNQMEYKTNFIMTFLYRLLPFMINVLVWLAISDSSTFTMDKDEIITYYMIGLITSNLVVCSIQNEISEDIRNGTINKLSLIHIFIRIEAGSNLIGGQPLSLENIKAVSRIAQQYGILLILDASLLQDNLYFIKEREKNCQNMSIREITKEISKCVDIIYFSARKLGFARGGGICIRNYKIFNEMQKYIPMFEGFTTYGGMSVKEMEAIVVGLEETMEENIISQGPQFIQYMVDKLDEYGIPVVKPGGGLGVHIDAKKFLSHIPLNEYPAGALTAAIYLCSGVRCMERGVISEQRNEDGTENYPKMELVRIALPRRVYTLSQITYVIDRIKWLYDNRILINGLRFSDEPEELRFYFGHLVAIDDWQERLIEKFKEDFGESL